MKIDPYNHYVELQIAMRPLFESSLQALSICTTITARPRYRSHFGFHQHHPDSWHMNIEIKLKRCAEDTSFTQPHCTAVGATNSYCH